MPQSEKVTKTPMYAQQVVAVVVTFNRLEFLKQVVSGLLNQNRAIDKIIIVNNSSTDETPTWLADLTKQNDKFYVITQPNLGSSGGQYTGAKTAVNLGYEWIWIMDDDVVPEPECLEHLLEFAQPKTVCSTLKIAFENEIHTADIKIVNMSNPFKSIWKSILSKDEYCSKDAVSVQAITFEGPIFHYTMFENAGFPDKKFFIYADDTEFSIRLLKLGYQFKIVRNARMQRLLPYVPSPNINDWKTYYAIRNLIAIDVLHGNCLIRTIRPFGYLLAWLVKSRNLKNIQTVFKAFVDGFFYKSEN